MRASSFFEQLSGRNGLLRVLNQLLHAWPTDRFAISGKHILIARLGQHMVAPRAAGARQSFGIHLPVKRPFSSRRELIERDFFATQLLFILASHDAKTTRRNLDIRQIQIHQIAHVLNYVENARRSPLPLLSARPCFHAWPLHRQNSIEIDRDPAVVREEVRGCKQSAENGAMEDGSTRRAKFGCRQ